jgi:hypothetical protein
MQTMDANNGCKQWMQMDANNGCKWMQMDANGCKWMQTMDANNGCKWMRFVISSPDTTYKLNWLIVTDCLESKNSKLSEKYLKASRDF